ncbi:MAG: hypothetical protein WCJ95_17925 [Mariniphaga sp.]
MIYWIKDNIGLKNVLILVLVVLVIVGFLFATSWYRMVLRSQYEGVTQARVTKIAPRTTSFQHHNGTSTKTVGYDITYYYEVKNKKFTNTEFIEPDYDNKLLFDHFNSGAACMIEIKYSNKKPSESVISKMNLKK